jgi:pimeloyl-ACP methyl ester carboxylesterase
MFTTEFMVRAKDMDISVRQSDGKGMPLLLLHGSGLSKDVFQRQFDSVLGETYRVTAIDLPGHGRSDNASNPEDIYTVTGLAETVSAVISTLDLVRPVVFGWSLGGHVAIELAARRSDLAGLVLTGTPPIGRGPLAGLRGFHTSWDMLLVSREVFTRRHAERYMRLCFGDHGSPEILADIERSDGKLRTNFLRSLLRGDGVDQLREVETNPVPLAMINGKHDPIVRRSHIEHLDYAHLWRSACQYIEGAGHAPFLEQPVEFNRRLHAFLKDIAVMPSIEGKIRAHRA